ncbi:hypothetical protein [Fibrobacter sp.]|uniref:hypothetical protein n=1 Tax=Fibrobacter sp. TaxID=35828 RepID=UPI00386F1558
MNIRLRKLLGKLFLSGASFFWASCDSGTSAEKPSAFIDIDQELAKITPTDTTGLRGKCIPKDKYCETTEGWSSYYSAQAHAASIAIEKLNEQHKDDPDYWYGYNSCYRNILGYLGIAPIYGVPECPTDLTPCETDGSTYSVYNQVRIDDAYIEALQREEQNYYEAVKSTLEKINEGMEKCGVQ